MSGKKFVNRLNSRLMNNFPLAIAHLGVGNKISYFFFKKMIVDCLSELDTYAVYTETVAVSAKNDRAVKRETF